MAAAKSMADPCLGVGGSTMVATMARNGTEFGIRVAGLGDRWFTAPVNTPEGLYFPGFGPADANPDIGDSAIVETVGLGGFAMAASPAVAGFVGAGGMADAVAVTEEMAEICLGEHPAFPHPHPRRPRHARRHRREKGRRDGHRAPDQHGNSRQGAGHRPDRRRHGASAARVLRAGARRDRGPRRREPVTARVPSIRRDPPPTSRP